MKKALTALLLSTVPALASTSTLPDPPAAMVILPTGQQGGPMTQQAAPFDGLGTNGVAWVGPWHSDGSVRVYLFTGDAPEPYGSFTLTFPLKVMAAGDRPICNATARRSSADYTFGYAREWWPAVNIQEGDYWLEQPQVAQQFVWQAQGWLQAWTAYEVDIICGVKQ